MSEFDEKTQEAIERIADGSLASGIKKNMKFATTGMILGAIVGIGVATFTGKCLLCLGFWGALAGGGLGYITAGNKKKDE